MNCFIMLWRIIYVLEPFEQHSAWTAGMPVTSGLLAIVPGNFAFHPLGARRLCQCRQHSALTFNTGKIGYGSRRVWALCSIQRLLKECVQMEVIYGKMTVMVRKCLSYSGPLLCHRPLCLTWLQCKLTKQMNTVCFQFHSRSQEGSGVSMGCFSASHCWSSTSEYW